MWFDIGGTTLANATAAVTFPLSPVLVLVVGDRSGFAASLAVFVAVPLLGFATLAVLAQASSFLTAWPRGARSSTAVASSTSCARCGTR